MDVAGRDDGTVRIRQHVEGHAARGVVHDDWVALNRAVCSGVLTPQLHISGQVFPRLFLEIL